MLRVVHNSRRQVIETAEVGDHAVLFDNKRVDDSLSWHEPVLEVLDRRVNWRQVEFSQVLCF